MKDGEGLCDGARIVFLVIRPEAFGLQLLEADHHRIEPRLLPFFQERRMPDDRIHPDVPEEPLLDPRGDDRVAELLRGAGIAEGVGVDHPDEGDVAEESDVADHGLRRVRQVASPGHLRNGAEGAAVGAPFGRGHEPHPQAQPLDHVVVPPFLHEVVAGRVLLHEVCRPVEAGGEGERLSGRGPGDAGDAFAGSVPGEAIDQLREAPLPEADHDVIDLGAG